MLVLVVMAGVLLGVVLGGTTGWIVATLTWGVTFWLGVATVGPLLPGG